MIQNKLWATIIIVITNFIVTKKHTVGFRLKQCCQVYRKVYPHCNDKVDQTFL